MAEFHIPSDLTISIQKVVIPLFDELPEYVDDFDKEETPQDLAIFSDSISNLQFSDQEEQDDLSDANPMYLSLSETTIAMVLLEFVSDKPEYCQSVLFFLTKPIQIIRQPDSGKLVPAIRIGIVPIQREQQDDENWKMFQNLATAYFIQAWIDYGDTRKAGSQLVDNLTELNTSLVHPDILAMIEDLDILADSEPQTLNDDSENLGIEPLMNNIISKQNILSHHPTSCAVTVEKLIDIYEQNFDTR